MTRREFALEIRKHWAEELLSGRKKVELRGYPLPEAVGESMIEMLFFFSRQVSLLSLSPLLVFFHNLLDNNKKPTTKGSSRVWLLATDGPAGQAALGDTIDPSEDRERAEVVGWARFDKRKEKVYRSAAEVEEWGAALAPRYQPDRLVLPIGAEVQDLPAALAIRAPGTTARTRTGTPESPAGPWSRGRAPGPRESFQSRPHAGGG